jgi:hypothetical protein
MYMMQDPPPPPSELLVCLLSIVFTILMWEIRSHLNQVILDRLCHRLNTSCLGRWWETGKFGIQTFKRLTIPGWWINWLSIHRRLFQEHVCKTLTLVLVIQMFTSPFCPSKWRLSNLTKILLVVWLGKVLIGPPQRCVCNVFHYDTYGDHL